MVKCFSIGIKNLTIGTCAFQTENEKIDYLIMREYISENRKFPSSLVLKKAEIKKTGLIYSDDFSGIINEWEDYQCNEFAYEMYSESVKNCLDELRTKDDDYEWVTVEIVGFNENKTYYVPFFNSLPDVLDEKNTKYLEDGRILRPCYDLDKISKYSIFTYENFFWKIPSILYVNEFVKKIMKKQNFSNIRFEGCVCSKNGVIFSK